MFFAGYLVVAQALLSRFENFAGEKRLEKEFGEYVWSRDLALGYNKIRNGDLGAKPKTGSSNLGNIVLKKLVIP
jgi:hypothetical protein